MPYRKMLISVGIFVVLTALILVVGFGYIIQKKGIFEKKFHYTLIASSGADLIEGMPMLYSGFEIGVVTKLTLAEDGRVEVVIEVPKHQLRWIRRSTLFNLNKPLIGSAAIEIESPMLDDEPLDYTSRRQLITIDGVNELIAKVQPVLDDLQGILSNINHMTDQQADLALILKNVELITSKISKTKAVTSLDAIMADVQGMIQKAEKVILGDNNSSISKINDMLDDISGKLQRLDQTVDAVNKSSSSIEGLTKDIKFSMKKTDEILEGVSGIIGSSPEGAVSLP